MTKFPENFGHINTPYYNLLSGLFFGYNHRMPVSLLIALGEAVSDRPRYISRKLITPISGMASGLAVTAEGPVPMELAYALEGVVDDLDICKSDGSLTIESFL